VRSSLPTQALFTASPALPSKGPFVKCTFDHMRLCMLGAAE
jgi:hypothetical protein